MDVTQKWDLFAATGWEDLCDAMEEAGIIMTQREAEDEVPEVPYLPFREAGENNDPPEQQERAHVPLIPAVEAIVPTPFEEGVEKIREVIGKYSNLIMQRKILMTEMPASDYTDWRKWGQMLRKQAQRCNYDDGTYTSEVAALDALLFQCPDAEWRRKILAGRMDFQKAIDYGMRNLIAKKQSDQLSQANRNGNGPSQIHPVDRVEEEYVNARHGARNAPNATPRTMFPVHPSARANPSQTEEEEDVETVGPEGANNVTADRDRATTKVGTKAGMGPKPRPSTRTLAASTANSGKLCGGGDTPRGRNRGQQRLPVRRVESPEGESGGTHARTHLHEGHP